MSGFLGGVVEAWREADAYAFKEKELIDRKLDTIVPQINESRLLQKELEKQAKRATQFYEKRLDGVLEGKEADAFLNAVNENPAKAIKVYEEITAAEKREGYAPISGEKLIAFYDFIEETKPEDMSREEWIEAGAKIAADPDIKNYDELLMALLASDDLDEVKSLSREFVPFQTPSVGFENFDYSALDVLPQSFINQTITNIVDIALAKARRKYTELTARVNDASNPLSPDEDKFRRDLEKELTQAKENELTILSTGYGAEAFKNLADYDIRVSKIPSLKNIYMNHEQFNFYDEDGNYIGIQ